MTYIENIFVMLATPLLASLLVVEGRPRLTTISMLNGMACCLLSAYVNMFFIQWVGAGDVAGAVEVAPVVEETIKLLPILFYLLVIEPSGEDARLAILFVAVGFATMESGFYLANADISEPVLLAMRGLGASMMHLTCGILMGLGLTHVWAQAWLKVAGTFGLLCFVITFHGIYNLLVAAGGAAQTVAVLLPALTLGVALTYRWWWHAANRE